MKKNEKLSLFWNITWAFLAVLAATFSIISAICGGGSGGSIIADPPSASSNSRQKRKNAEEVAKEVKILVRLVKKVDPESFFLV